MPTNDFLPFATGGTPNVIDQATYAALAARSTGFQVGIADPTQLNKVWRQSSIFAAAVAQFIADQTGQNVVDDGTTSTIETNLLAAIQYAASHLGAIPQGRQVFTSSGTFTVPANVTRVRARVWGGGGGGAGGNSSNGGGGGGGGGYSEKLITGLTPGATVAVTVGAAGSAGSASSAGGNGGTSSFGSYCSASGGTGGSASSGLGVAGGSGSSGDFNFSGGYGQIGTSANGGNGGSSPGGGGSSSGGPGSPAVGVFPGGGGAGYGPSANAGGAGAAGIVIVEW